MIVFNLHHVGNKANILKIVVTADLLPCDALDLKFVSLERGTGADLEI